MFSAAEFAAQACSSKYDKLKYSQYDCQGFVELVLRDCGIRKSDGSVYNWTGSNKMWRVALSWKGSITDCVKQFGSVPPGAWVFMVAHDGGEVARGYHDTEGNASHVGVYVGNDKTRDSTKGTGRDGVGFRPLKDWTHVGFCKYLDYSEKKPTIINVNADELKTVNNQLTAIQKIVKGWMEK